MRILFILLACFCAECCYAQLPYVKKLSYPEQLPTQRVFNILTDSKGYIWIGTDKGLYRYNGRAFVFIPITNTTSKEVSYLQEDSDGVIWCMNFYNQLFYYRDDSLHRFEFDFSIIKEKNTFSNVFVGSEKIWFHSYIDIYEIDKKTKKVSSYTYPGFPKKIDLIIGSCFSNNQLNAITYEGDLYTTDGKGKSKWTSTGHKYSNMRLVGNDKGLIALSGGLEKKAPIEIRDGKWTTLKPIDLPKETFVIGAVYMPNGQYWICTYNGVYLWDKETGKTTCYLPKERVSDIVMDYQGNYWISTLDNGIFLCPSLYNTLIKVYNDPFLDNFSRLEVLPDGKVVLGNTQGMQARFDPVNNSVLHYDAVRGIEVSFIQYDKRSDVIISNNGVFRSGSKKSIDPIDYSKGIARDKYGNLLVAVYNSAVVANDHFGSKDRIPKGDVYTSKPIAWLDRDRTVKLLRLKRSNAVLGSAANDVFWVAYEDGLYQYDYNGGFRILVDTSNAPIVAKALLQLNDGNLAAGTSTKGVMILKNEKVVRIFDTQTGLSNNNVKKIVQLDNELWILTEAGLDKVDLSTGSITNYLEEYGLSSIIINDFSINEDRILFATPTGLLQRFHVPPMPVSAIRFPLLKARSNGKQVNSGQPLPANMRDIVFNFEALHYLSTTALTYRYRLLGFDTVWHTTNSTGQLAFNRLSPGEYRFQVQAVAGSEYKSVVREFTFVVFRRWWQHLWVWLVAGALVTVLSWLLLLIWKKRLISRQGVKEKLLKSQLVALRAQMNPHFLYNVLNTAQGLVYGNRKTEAGVLLGNFSDLMRKVLQASDKQFLPLRDEIENLQLYLELEKARFDEGFSYSIELINIDDTATTYIPSLLLQPFAENAVKHGLLHKKGDKKLAICFEKVQEGIKVTIEDNGIGRKRSLEINRRIRNKPSSFATMAIGERMGLFNRLHKGKITCLITDKTDEDDHPAGTCVTLIIPDYGAREDILWNNTPAS